MNARLHATDERIQAGRDRAGNLSFGFVMAILFVWLGIAILLNRTEDYAPLGMTFLAGCVFYLIQLIRSGAAYTAPNLKLGPGKMILSLVAGGLAYWIVGTGLEIRDFWGKADPLPLLKIMGENAVRTLLWISCVIGLLVIIDRINRRRIDKRLGKQSDS